MNSQIYIRLISANTFNASYRMVLMFHYAMNTLLILKLNKRLFVLLSKHVNRQKKVALVMKMMKVPLSVKHRQMMMKKWRLRSFRSKKNFMYTASQISGISTSK